MSARTAVYRLFADDDALLYVGVTNNVVRRRGQHRKDKPWWPQVTRQTVEWHPDRATAEAAETTAIQAERPVHNIRAALPPGVDIATATLINQELADAQADYVTKWARAKAMRRLAVLDARAAGWSKYRIAATLGVKVPTVTAIIATAEKNAAKEKRNV